MIVEHENTRSVVDGIEDALAMNAGVVFFHENSQELVDWVRQQKIAPLGADMHSFGLLLKLLEQLFQKQR